MIARIGGVSAGGILLLAVLLLLCSPRASFCQNPPPRPQPPFPGAPDSRDRQFPGFNAEERLLANDAPPSRSVVLLLSSNMDAFAYPDPKVQAILKVLRESKMALDVQMDVLDPHQLMWEAYAQKIKDLYRFRYRHGSFRVILTTDNASLRFVLREHDEIFGGAPVVFCGLRGLVPEISRHQENTTGVMSGLSAIETLRTALRLHPQARQVVVLHDLSRDGMGDRRSLESALSKTVLNTPLTYDAEVSPKEAVDLMRNLPPTSIVLLMSNSRSRGGDFHRQDDALREMRKAGGAPIYTTREELVGYGAVGGCFFTAVEQGTMAAGMALRVLRGERASAIPVYVPAELTPVFDYHELQNLNIPPGLLPPGATVLNKSVSFYEAHQYGVWAFVVSAVSLLTVGIILLLFYFERRGALRVLRKSEQRYRSLFSNNQSIILLLDPDTGNIEDCNPAAAEFYGRPREGLMKMSVFDIFAISPEELRGILNETSVTRQGHYFSRHRIASGEVRDVEIFGGLVEASGRMLMYSFVHDVTDRRLAEQALSRSEALYREQSELLRDILSSIPDYVYWKNSDGIYQGCNENFARLAGLEKPEDIVGKNSEFLALDDDIRESLKEGELKCMLEGEVIRNQEVVLRLPGGAHKTLLASKAPLIHSGGAMAGLIASYTDITARKVVEAEREELLAELEQKNKELESIIYVASHDLRSPLVNVQGFSQRLEKIREDMLESLRSAGEMEPYRDKILPVLTERIPRALNFIRASAEKMDSLINGLLRLSRTGRASLNPELLDVKGMVEDILSAMAYQIQSAGVLVDVGNLPPCTGDRIQINQVFSNLLDNALKYRDSERPLVLGVSGRYEGNGVVYCIEDTGKGIAPEHLGNIWGLFQRLEPNGAVPGEGLGLTLVRRIMERHRGRAWAESVLGEGSRFFIALPMEIGKLVG